MGVAKYCGELVNIGGKGVVNIGAGGGGGSRPQAPVP